MSNDTPLSDAELLKLVSELSVEVASLRNGADGAMDTTGAGEDEVQMAIQVIQTAQNELEFQALSDDYDWLEAYDGVSDDE